MLLNHLNVKFSIGKGLKMPEIDFTFDLPEYQPSERTEGVRELKDVIRQKSNSDGLF